MSLSYNKRVIELNKQHILEHMSEDEFIRTVSAKLQCNYLLDYRQEPPRGVYPTVYNAIIEMTFQGDFLISTADIVNYLNNTLCINPQNKEFTATQSLNMYAALLARDGVKLYYKLLKDRKLYNW